MARRAAAAGVPLGPEDLVGLGAGGVGLPRLPSSAGASHDGDPGLVSRRGGSRAGDPSWGAGGAPLLLGGDSGGGRRRAGRGRGSSIGALLPAAAPAKLVAATRAADGAVLRCLERTHRLPVLRLLLMAWVLLLHMWVGWHWLGLGSTGSRGRGPGGFMDGGGAQGGGGQAAGSESGLAARPGVGDFTRQVGVLDHLKAGTETGQGVKQVLSRPEKSRDG